MRKVFISGRFSGKDITGAFVESDFRATFTCLDIHEAPPVEDVVHIIMRFVAGPDFESVSITRTKLTSSGMYLPVVSSCSVL
jgi:hypothetical protein